MGATAEISGVGGGRRLVLAFGLSVGVHAFVAVLAPGWRVESRPASPLVVTMIARGGGEGAGAPPGTSEGTAPHAEAVAAPAPADVAPPARVAERVPTIRAPRPVRRGPVEIAPAPVAPPASVAVAAAEHDGVDTVVSHGIGSGAAANDGGSGAVGAGGLASGAGVGSDGLRAFCASCPAPEYPGRARRQGWQGTVDVTLAIARDGSVHEARVDRSSGYPALDDVALDVARRSRFAVPDGGDGLRGQLRYRFVLDATAARR